VDKRPKTSPPQTAFAHRECNALRPHHGRVFKARQYPLAAVFIVALVNCELPRGVPAAIAIAGSMIAGITTVDAVLRPHW
jgi:hypothetical protein